MSEDEAIRTLDLMAQQSLQPYEFDKWLSVRESLVKKRNIVMPDDLLSVDDLMTIHPGLKVVQAIDLLIYAKEQTITLKGCYGDGSNIYPEWKKSRQLKG